MKQTSLLLLLCLFSVQAMCQDIFLGTNKEKIANYYIMSMKRTKNGYIDVFERVKPADGKLAAFREQLIAQRTKMKLSTEGLDKVGYYRRRIQFSCKGKIYRMREETYYDLYGKEISTNDPDPAENAKWEFIPPSTMREIEFNKACQ